MNGTGFHTTKKGKVTTALVLRTVFRLESIFRGTINKREFRVIALHRSGHHAIIEWILSNLNGTYCFLNDCLPNTNPYLSCNVSNSLINGINLNMERLGRHKKKDFLIYNHESHGINEILNSRSEQRHDRWLGKTQNVCNILVLRDAFNFFASRIKYGYQFSSGIGAIDCEKLEKLIGIYKSYAREFLGETNHLTNKVVVSYNEWFASETYRSKLLGRLELPVHNTNIETVSRYGGGSSFENKSFRGKSSSMRVFKRWQAMSEDNMFRSVFNDKELVDLSNEIFGNIEGTEVLF